MPGIKRSDLTDYDRLKLLLLLSHQEQARAREYIPAQAHPNCCCCVLPQRAGSQEAADVYTA